MCKYDQIYRGDDDTRRNYAPPSSSASPSVAGGRGGVGQGANSLSGGMGPGGASNPMGGSVASEVILSKEQLYDMFQTILGVKKYEHQILYNAMQVTMGWWM